MTSIEVRTFIDRLADGALDSISVARMANERDPMGLHDPAVRGLAQYVSIGTVAHLVSEADRAGASDELGAVMGKIAARWMSEALGCDGPQA